MSEPAADAAATSFPAPSISLPLGLDVLRTYSGALVCVEIVSVVPAEGLGVSEPLLLCELELRVDLAVVRTEPAWRDEYR